MNLNQPNNAISIKERELNKIPLFVSISSSTGINRTATVPVLLEMIIVFPLQN